MDKILVIIPVVNLWDAYTIHAMESLAAQKCSLPFEIVIVDNGSVDETVNKATDFGNRKMPGRVHIIHHDTNKGCGGGWNAGLDFGKANGFTHFAILNNDILVGPNTIQAMYDRMKKGGVMLTSAVDVMREVIVPQQVLDASQPVNNKDESESPHPNFSCYMIDADTVAKVGMFDEDFFPAYFEDNDYHYRIKLAGGTAIANTKAIFVHYGSRTQNQEAGKPVVPGDTFRANEAYFIRKWGGSPGHEKFDHPFNNIQQDLTYAKRR